MIISVIPSSQLLIKTGIGCHIDLTAKDRPDPLCPTRFIKIDHPIHNAMVCDRCTVHAKLLNTPDIFLYFVGTVQKTVFCMYMKMRKCHICFLLFSFVEKEYHDHYDHDTLLF